MSVSGRTWSLIACSSACSFQARCSTRDHMENTAFNFRVAAPRSEIYSQTFLNPSIDFISRPLVMNLVSWQMMSWNTNPIHKLQVEIGHDDFKKVFGDQTIFYDEISENNAALLVFIFRASALLSYDDVIKWKHFPRYWPFVRGIHWSPANSPHKGQWRGALMFYLICAWINGWVNNREAGDLRRNRAHYDVTVICLTGSVCLRPVRLINHDGWMSGIRWAPCCLLCWNRVDIGDTFWVNITISEYVMRQILQEVIWFSETLCIFDQMPFC